MGEPTRWKHSWIDRGLLAPPRRWAKVPDVVVNVASIAMRCGLVLLMLVFAAGPVLAQESMRPGRPGPIEPAKPAAPAKHQAKHAAKHHPAKPQAANAAKPTAAKPTASKPAISKSAANKPPASKTVKRAPALRHVPLPRPAPRATLASIAPTSATAAPAHVPLPPRQPAAIDAKPAMAEPAHAVTGGVPSNERWKIQSALLWAGDYPSSNKDGDPLVAAIKNYQKRHKAKVTGELTAEQRATLIAADEAHEKAFGWSVVVDPATGIRIGLPTKLVPHARDATHGTRWSSAHGEVQIETFRIKDPDLKLSTLYEREKRQPATRRIAHNTLHDDGFSIDGMQGLKYFSVRAAIRDGEIRGLTMLYDQAMEGIVEPVLVAVASAFSPFPERSAPFATLAKSVEYGTGLIVSSEGHIVTARKVTEGCQVIVVPGLGNADRLAQDKTDGLALLRVYGQHKLSALSLANGVPKSAPLTLLGIPDPKEQHGRQRLSEIKARLAGTAIELRQPVPVAGLPGAAALDAQGQVLGMMDTRNAVIASTAPSAPPVWLVGAPTIRAFLKAHHVPAVKSPGEARDAVVRVICVRK